MRTKSLIINTTLIFLFVVAFVITGCKKNEEAGLPEDATIADTTQTVQAEEEAVKPIDQKEIALKKELKALLAEVDKKQHELLDKERYTRQMDILTSRIFSTFRNGFKFKLIIIKKITKICHKSNS